MTKLIDITPDKIVEIDSGHHLFVFSGGLDDSKLPIGAEYVVVYSPGGYNTRWHATRYQVMPSNEAAVQALNDRDLTAEEIVHFEKLIEEQ